MSILLADDDPFLQKVANVIQPKLGASTVVSNGQEAVDEYKKQGSGIRLVILDLEMPVLNGVDSCKQIRDHQKSAGLSCKVVALSGDDDEATIKNCETAGFDSHIVKPQNKDKIDKLL